MEFPELGQQCSSEVCKQLDFLPMKCDACKNIYCKDHIQYSKHSCTEGQQRDVQVPVCPLCNQPVPTRRGEPPDIRVGEHIDRDCQSDPAQAKRNKLYTKKCQLKGCKQKEMISVTCSQCHQNFCLKHRHTLDHNCQGFQSSGRQVSKAGTAASSRLLKNSTVSNKSMLGQAAAPHRDIPKAKPAITNQRAPVAISRANTSTQPNASMLSDVQGQLSEDEALAMALQQSMMDEEESPQFRSQWTNDMHLPPALHTSQEPSRRTSTNCTLS